MTRHSVDGVERVRAALSGRLGLGPSPALALLARLAPHPVWLRGEAALWRAPRGVVAVSFEDRVWACAGLSAEEAWQAHVGAELLRATEPTCTTIVPRSVRLGLRDRLREGPPPWPPRSRPRILWQTFLRFGRGTIALGRVAAAGESWGLVLGHGLRFLDPRPLPPVLLLQIAMGHWWLGGTGCYRV